MARPEPKGFWEWMRRPIIILVQKKPLSVKIDKILEGGARVKDAQVENVKSKSELKNFFPFSLESLRERLQLGSSSALEKREC